MAKYIRNDSGATDTWSGQELTNGQVYQLTYEDEHKFLIDSRESGSKVETDVLSGDLKVSEDNFTTTLSAADGLFFLQSENANCIHDKLIQNTSPAHNQVLKFNAANNRYEFASVPESSGDMATVSVKRTTTLALVATPNDVSFDVEDVENKPAVLEHHDTNTARMYLHESSHYFATLSCEIFNNNPQDKTVTIELWRNGTSSISSTTVDLDKNSSEHLTRVLVIPPLTPGDYITIRMGGADLTLKEDARVNVFQMSGTVGATGPAGIAGADGDITWQGAWVSQNYTANQAVKYTDGSSYVCHTDTTASQVPTDTNFWDCLAEKGDTGPAGGGGNKFLVIMKDNGDDLTTNSGTYAKLARLVYDGANETLLGAKVHLYRSSGTSVQCRIYDVTNAQEIASVTTTSTSTSNIVTFGTLSNLPSSLALLNIEFKSTGGGNCHTSGILMEF